MNHQVITNMLGIKLYCYLNVNYLKKDWDRNRIIYEINQKGFPSLVGGCSEIYLENCFINSNLNPKKDYLLLKN